MIRVYRGWIVNRFDAKRLKADKRGDVLIGTSFEQLRDEIDRIEYIRMENDDIGQRTCRYWSEKSGTCSCEWSDMRGDMPSEFFCERCKNWEARA